MEQIYYNKLCRDKIPAIIKSKGYECEVRIVGHDEYKREIVRKVYEEASGITDRSSKDHMVEELADLLITLEALKKEFNISDSEVSAAIEASLGDKGGYEERLYLSWSADIDYLKQVNAAGIDD